MKNKETLILTIIIVLFLIFVVGAATYAYFMSSTDVTGANFNVATTTANSTVFSAYTEGNISFNINSKQMTQNNVSEEYIATDSAMGTAKIEAGNSRYTTTCTYDLVWIWDSEDRYMMSDVDLPYAHGDGTVYPYEFSVKVDDEAEKDLSSFDWSEDGKAIISHKELTSENGAAIEDKFNIQVSMYNLPIVQNNLFSKNFTAHITIENNKCTTLESGIKLNYYVYNTTIGKYEKAESIPKGDYRLNTSKTSCQNGGTINSYDNVTGTIDTTLENHEVCDIYFSVLDRIKASGTNVTSSFDGNLKYITVDVERENSEIYYSTVEELTPTTYTRGSRTNPGISALGTTRVYWCATAEDCVPYCSSNTITIGEGIMTGAGKDYTGTYDGASHGIEVNITNPVDATIYYLAGTEINSSNYKTKGSTTNPTRSSAGTTIVYWCAEKQGYTTLCGNNKITINKAAMSASGKNYNGSYTSGGANIVVNVTKPVSGYQIYYSTTMQLTSNNYTSGSTSNPTITKIGTTTVYWCAVADNYNPVCSSNNVIISKGVPTLAVQESVSSPWYPTRSITISYSYDGDGTISCTNATYTSCSVNQTNKTITFTTPGWAGTNNITITASGTANYESVTKIVAVTWTCLDPETLVDMWDKKKKKKKKRKIKEIEEGDIVYCYDYESEAVVTRKVKKVHINKAKEVYHLILDNDEIKITGDHPVCVEQIGYLKVLELKVGYKLVGQDGSLHEIKEIKVEILDEEQDMYSLELEDGSSFIIGKNGIVCLAMFVSAMAAMIPSVHVYASGS